MIEHKPNENITAAALEGNVNWVPWSVQQTFRGVLFTLIPWIGFNLLLGALGSNASGPSKPLSFGDDLGSAIIGLIFTALIEGAFLIAPYYYANRTRAAQEMEETGERVRAVLKSLGLRGFSVTRTLPWIVGLLLAIIAVNVLYSLAISLLHLNIQTNDQVVLQNSANEPLTTYAVLAGSVLIAPFCEEIFFRGFVFTGLLHDLSPAWAILVSASLFAIAHADPSSFLPLFAIGIGLGILRWRTGSTWASMSLHILNNLLSSIIIVLAMHGINVPI